MIIGFCGFKGSGKSTAANGAFSAVCENYDNHRQRVARRSFAEPLKDTCNRLFGLVLKSQLYGDKKEVVDPRYGKTPRQILQEVGSFFRDNYGDDFWINALDRQRVRVRYPNDADFALDSGGITIIDDVRYPNEADFVRNSGGIVIGIRRPGNGLDDDHASETKMHDHWDSMIDVEIVNDGTITDLRDRVKSVIEDSGILCTR